MRQALAAGGLDLSLDQLGLLANSEGFFKQVTDGRTLPSEAAALVKQAIRNAFAVPAMKSDLERRLASVCKPEQWSQVVQDLKSPLLARMMRLEAEAVSPETQAQVAEYTASLRQTPPDADRMQEIQKLDESAGATDFSAGELVALTLGLNSGGGGAAPNEAAMRDYREEMKRQIHESILVSMLFVYRNVGKEDLERYAMMLRTAPLRGFYEQARQAFLGMVEDHSRQMVEEVKKKVAPPAK